jgi:RND family efflux transporter MFP subunit
MLAKFSHMRKRHRTLVAGALILIFLVAGGIATAQYFNVRARKGAGEIPTAEAYRGELVDSVELRGEMKAVKSVVLTAPSSAGDIQIVKLARNGTMAKKGDVLVQLDVTTLQNTLAQNRSDLKQAQAQIEGSRAQARLQQEQDRTDLLKSNYDVQRARLETSKQEILSQIDAGKNRLLLADSEQKVKEVEQKLASDKTSAAADLASKKQKSEKFRFEVRQGESRVAAMTLRAPVDGMVTIMPNFRAAGFFGSSAPEFKEGDRAWPGATLLELPDLSTLQVVARVDESDRSRLRRGQSVKIRVDAVPDREFTGRVNEISSMAKPDFSSWPPTKNFDMAVHLDKTDPRLRPGMSATARVAASSVANALLIPAEAAFSSNGQTVVYVLSPRAFGGEFAERAIVTGGKGDGQLEVLQGLKPGERVALKRPIPEKSK